MFSLTDNEIKVLNFLIRHFDERNSINAIAKKLEITPMGVHKISKKLEAMNVISPERIGNAIYYKINLNDELGKKVAEFILAQNELNSYSMVQAQDFEKLKDIVQACILFGSVLYKGNEARDIDVLLLIEKEKFREISKRLDSIRQLKPKKIHDLMMTRQDLEESIKKKDEVIKNIIITGKVVWGSETIIEAIKNGTA